MWFLQICFHHRWWQGAELRPDVPRMQSSTFLGGTKRVRDLWFGEGKWKAFCRYVRHIGINKTMTSHFHFRKFPYSVQVPIFCHSTTFDLVRQKAHTDALVNEAAALLRAALEPRAPAEAHADESRWVDKFDRVFSCFLLHWQIDTEAFHFLIVFSFSHFFKVFSGDLIFLSFAKSFLAGCCTFPSWVRTSGMWNGFWIDDVISSIEVLRMKAAFRDSTSWNVQF